MLHSSCSMATDSRCQSLVGGSACAATLVAQNCRYARLSRSWCSCHSHGPQLAAVARITTGVLLAYRHSRLYIYHPGRHCWWPCHGDRLLCQFKVVS